MSSFPPALLPCTKELAKKYSNFIFDCDGVLWNASSAIPNASKFLKLLKENDKKVYFVTNNGMSTRAEYKEKIKKLLDFDTEEDKIYTSSYLAAQYIKLKHPEFKSAFVLGMDALCYELEQIGLKVTGGHEHDDKYGISYEEIRKIHFENKVDAVVCSYDEKFNLYKLLMASIGIQQGVSFLH